MSFSSQAKFMTESPSNDRPPTRPSIAYLAPRISSPQQGTRFVQCGGGGAREGGGVVFAKSATNVKRKKKVGGGQVVKTCYPAVSFIDLTM